MRIVRILGAASAAMVLLGVVTVGTLIALNAECNGGDCPRSDAYRYTLVAMLGGTLALLVGGAVTSIVRRRLWPLVLSVAAVLALVALVDAALSSIDIATVVLLVAAALVGRAALRRAVLPPA